LQDGCSGTNAGAPKAADLGFSVWDWGREVPSKPIRSRNTGGSVRNALVRRGAFESNVDRPEKNTVTS